MAGMRDVLIHGYFGVDLELTWKTVKEDLPKLKNKLSEMSLSQKSDVLKVVDFRVSSSADMTIFSDVFSS